MLNTWPPRDRPLGKSLLNPEPTTFPLDVLLPSEAIVQLQRLIPQQTTVLVTGETGTGKTWLARRIHELSPRRSEPFVHVTCAALTPGLIESELFGHVAGAFTGAERDRQGKFAAAGRGTLLLDEIGSLPLTLQSKLLRVVDDRTFEPVGADKPELFEARLIATSSGSLEREAAAGSFRLDLFYRLNVVSFQLPPLREQRHHVAPLAQKILIDVASRNRLHVKAVSRNALRLLECHDWPGNIRELRNVIERATALASGTEICPQDLPLAIRELGSFPPSSKNLTPSLMTTDFLPDRRTLLESRQQAEIARISQALHKHQNNRMKVAAELGISRMSLYKKLHKYGLIGGSPRA